MELHPVHLKDHARFHHQKLKKEAALARAVSHSKKRPILFSQRLSFRPRLPFLPFQG